MMRTNDPRALLQNMANQNPDLASALQQANWNPKDAFFKLAAMKGIDPTMFLGSIKMK